MQNIIAKVIEREGGDKLTKDPSDPGGTTKYGISQRANPDVDIENLTLEQAIDIYTDKYWHPSRAIDFPKHLMDMYFDMCVNFGQFKAVKIVQEAVNHKSKNTLKVDGRIGPKTLAAVQTLELNRLRSFRIMHYVKICMANKKLMKYYYGWFRRTMHI
tara:strand:+ start:557 stop:1030 length:474 start_codon:yes stop_codon:yes gene_type:complete